MHTRFPPRFAHEPPPVGKEFLYWAAQHLLNFQDGKPRVSLNELLAGAEGGIGSVLYDPDDEFLHDATPRPEAFPNLLAQMENVEKEVAGRVAVVRNPAELRKRFEAGEKLLFHCVEGAFGLGGDAANADVLASKGVAYVTVAHLFYRGVSACQNAFPGIPDSIFESVLNADQEGLAGLTDLGRSIVDRLLTNRILVDVTHATDAAQDEMFDMARDHGQPVISSHNGVRSISDYPLNLRPEAVARIVESGGVIGVILFPYWLRRPDEQFLGAEHIQLVFRTIRALHEMTGSYDHIAIGSDLDGFIRPIEECPDYAHTRQFADLIRVEFPDAADRILWGNALDVLERGWKGVPSDAQNT
jgi:microsomal dipeptidase-like Zn-dependent dipeptidase